jgi:hypothetical protein
MRNDFAAFILTHGRANSVVTHRTLERCGYTGKLFYLVDDEDKQIDEYKRQFGKQVCVFSKSDAAENCDSGNNYGRRNSILFARNACFDVARQLGLKYFWELDDDYTQFSWTCNLRGEYFVRSIRCLDKVLEACVQFLEDSNALTVAFAQGGDFIGGGEGQYAEFAANGEFTRKAMNSFICDVDRPIRFRGVFNEDVSTYVESGRQGNLFITIPRLRIQQKATQSQAGGITELYLDCGTYVKAFSTVMYAPSCTKVSTMGSKFRRIHHQIRWANVSPKIISESRRRKAVSL